MESLFSHFSETHRIVVYSVVFLVVFLIEGEITLTLAGVLCRNRFLDLFDLMAIGFVAAVLHDVLYWSVGVQLAKTFREKFLFVSADKVRTLLGRLKNRYGLFIFVSKFAWGSNKPVLAATGYMHVPLKELLRYSVPTCLVWAVGLILLGYSFASQTGLLRKDIKTATLLLLGFVIVILILQEIIRRILRGRSGD
jgi:membrane protein DedA with SNARE-associated domain